MSTYEEKWVADTVALSNRLVRRFWEKRITLLLWKGYDEVFGDSIGEFPIPEFCSLPETLS